MSDNAEKPPQNKKRKPRKGLFSLAVAENIFDMIQKGNYGETAAAFAGISKSTYFEWLRRGRSEIRRIKENPRAKVDPVEADFVFFCQKVEMCLAECEAKGLGRIIKAAEGGFVTLEIKEKKDSSGKVIETTTIRKILAPEWQAEAWRLERMFPKRYGRRLEVSKGEANKNEPGESPEELMQKCHEISEKMMTFEPTGAPPRDKESCS